MPCPSGHSHWPILQEFCTEESESFTIRNDQAKDGQESTFYMAMPPLISVRLLSLFWLLKILFDLGLTSLSTFFSHIATVSGCGRELNAHF